MYALAATLLLLLAALPAGAGKAPPIGLVKAPPFITHSIQSCDVFEVRAISIPDVAAIPVMLLRTAVASCTFLGDQLACCRAVHSACGHSHPAHLPQDKCHRGRPLHSQHDSHDRGATSCFGQQDHYPGIRNGGHCDQPSPLATRRPQQHTCLCSRSNSCCGSPGRGQDRSLGATKIPAHQQNLGMVGNSVTIRRPQLTVK